MVAKPSFNTICDLNSCSIVENGEVQLQYIIFFFMIHEFLQIRFVYHIKQI